MYNSKALIGQELLSFTSCLIRIRVCNNRSPLVQSEQDCVERHTLHSHHSGAFFSLLHYAIHFSINRSVQRKVDSLRLDTSGQTCLHSFSSPTSSSQLCEHTWHWFYKKSSPSMLFLKMDTIGVRKPIIGSSLDEESSFFNLMKVGLIKESILAIS